jgi:hypothetical protein
MVEYKTFVFFLHLIYTAVDIVLQLNITGIIFIFTFFPILEVYNNYVCSETIETLDVMKQMTGSLKE